MIRAVIFDMDGVLVDSEPYYRQRRSDFLALHGMRLSPDFDGVGSNDRAIWRELVPHDEALRERLRREYLAYASEHPAPWRELASPGVPEVFFALGSRGVKTAICSSSRRSFVEGFIGALGLERLLDLVVTGDECSELKPSPEPYLATMRGLGVRAEETVVVEDSAIGIEAAVRSGALTCAIALPSGDAACQTAAQIRLTRLMEVVDLVR